MEIFNNLDLTQQFLKENMKRVKNIDLDCHGIDITFDGGGSVSLNFDGADIVLNINYEAGEKKEISTYDNLNLYERMNSDEYKRYENESIDCMAPKYKIHHRESCDGEWEDIYDKVDDSFIIPTHLRKHVCYENIMKDKDNNK